MYSIDPELRGLAALTHLSGLAGYIIPLGGILVPITIWVVKSDTPVIVSIAKQAILLNVAVWVTICGLFILWITIVLIPILWLLSMLVGLAAVVLPIVGAIKASEGSYFEYPLVGVPPF